MNGNGENESVIAVRRNGLIERSRLLRLRLMEISPVNDSEEYHSAFKELVSTDVELRALPPLPTFEEELAKPKYFSRVVLESVVRPLPPEDLYSEVERMYWTAYDHLRLPDLVGLVPQCEVLDGTYRIDFALPNECIGVEVDGYAYHSDPATFTRDRMRQREIERIGWRLIRFSGKEVCDDALGCVIETARLVRVFRLMSSE